MTRVCLAEIPLDRIVAHPRARSDDPTLDELIASIRTVGLIQPLVVTDQGGRFHLLTGGRRWRASRAAGLSTALALVCDNSGRHTFREAAVENIRSGWLTPLQEAGVYAQLVEFDATTDEIATRVGRSRSHVSERLRLLQLPEPVRAAMGRGDLTVGHARVLLAVHDRDAQLQMADRIIRERLGVRAAERAAATARRARTAPDVHATTSADRAAQPAELPDAETTPQRRRGAWRRLLAVTAGDDDAEFVTHAPPVPIGEIVRRFRPYLRGRRAALAVTIAATAAVPLVETAEIWLFKVVIDDILVPHRFGLFPQVALAYVGLTLLTGLLTFVDGILSTWLSQRFLIDLRSAVFSHLQRLSPDFYERRRMGDLVSRVTSDTDAIESFLVSGSQTLASSSLRLIIFTVALFVLDWRLALVSLLVAPLFWVVSRYFSRRIKVASRERRRRSGSISVVVEEALRNVNLVQAYNREGRELDRLRRASEANYRAEMASARLGGVFSPVVDVVELVGALVVIGFGTWQLSQGHLTIGGLLIFMTLLSRLYSPIRGLTRLANSAYSASAGAERVIEVLTEQPRVTDPPNPKPVKRKAVAVEFRDVSFWYPGDHAPGSVVVPALDRVSFRVGPGEVLALVGPSGAGKSTIARLLLRSFDATDGQVLVGGTDVRELSLRSLREVMAVVLQETLVFDGSVRDNIAYGRADATDDQIVAAARAADAHEFIVALPDGYDTRIGERGMRLSGGQRQRLAIARAMVRDAPVLLLDEPTTGLDAESGHRMLAPLRRLMAGRTTIVISHNLLTVQDASAIVVLDHGRVVERGAHEELLVQHGLYARLHRLSGLTEPLQRMAATG